MKPRLLDLFCGAGGAAMGYHRAGFEVVGVDVEDQLHYPFEFVQADVLELLPTATNAAPEWGWWDEAPFDVIHASPPCQAYSDLQKQNGRTYPDLIGPVRELLTATALPWVIENVEGAPLRNPVRLCGSSFGLGVWRHRLFEASFALGDLWPPCSHREFPEPVDVTGTGGRRTSERKRGGGNSRKPRTLDEAREVMGIDWMTRRELSEAIPPAYTEHIGHYLMEEVRLNARRARKLARAILDRYPEDSATEEEKDAS